MAADIGVSIGIDGEKEYRRSITQIRSETKSFETELKAVDSTLESETTVMEKNRKKRELLTKGIKDQEKRVEELEKGLEASKKKYGENGKQTVQWKNALNDATVKLNKFKKDLDKVPTSLSQVGKSMQTAGKKMQSVGTTMSKYVTAPIVAVGAASIAAFREVDDGLDTIAKKTGATGQALEELEGAAKNIATTIPTTFEEAGNAVGTVNTRFGLTGQACEDLSTKFLKFAKINNQDVTTSIEGTQKVMAAFGLETEDADELLDAMNKTGQKTGISMDSLQSSMVKNAAALQDMGLNAYDAADFLGQVETSGANTDTVMQGLTKALVNANDEGKTLPQALGEFQSIMNSTASDQEKLNAAIELFGKKAGPAIYEACQQGSLSFESLSSDASEYLGSVESTFDAVLDPADQFEVTMNSLKVLGSEVGKSLLNAAAPAIEDIGGKLKDAADWFGNLDEKEQTFITNTAAGLALGAPLMIGIGRLTTAIGTVVDKIGTWEGVPAMISSAVTNPVGLAILAVGGLIGAFNLLDKSSGYLNEKVQGVVTGTNEAISAMDSATSSLSDTLATAESELGEINGKADLADDLINELAELESQSELTAEQQGRMRTIVHELNSLFPEMGASINSVTGELNMSTDEMRDYVAQARKMKLVEAYQKAATKGYEELATSHLALDKAQKQQGENQEVINGLLAEQNRLNSLVEDSNGNLVDSEGNFVMAANALDAALSQNAQDLQIAEEKQSELNAATEEAQTAYDNASETIADYEQLAADTAAELEALTSSTDSNTEAAESNTNATEANKQAIAEWGSEVASSAQTAVTNIGAAATKWGELYQATKDSIEKQIGLFDEWEQNNDLSFDDMEKNLDSQIKGMQDYATNMGKLSKAAVKSSDPNFKAFVQALNEMGIGAAGEVQTLVNMMENEPERFNAYVAKFGENRQEAIDNVAGISTYIQNDFTNGIGMGLIAATGAFDKAFSKEQFQKLGKNILQFAQNSGKTIENSAKTSSKNASNTIETEINNTDPEPTVQKVEVPEKVITDTKNNINTGISALKGNVSAIATAAAASAAKTKIEGKIDSLSGTVTSVSVSQGALSNIKSAISGFLQNNPVTAWINANVLGKKADGGFTYREHLTWISEGNKPEVVIPLSSEKRDRAMSLYQQTGEILGVASPNVQSYTVPGGTTDRVKVSFNAERMYEAVAAGAKSGMENANISIYIDNREAGRILKGMGVAFA